MTLHYGIIPLERVVWKVSCEQMTKEEMQRFLIKEAQRGSTELEAYRNLMEILGIEFPIEKEKV